MNPLDAETVRLLLKTSWTDPRDRLRDCPGCGRPFWVSVYYPQKRYCSKACVMRVWRRRDLARARADERERQRRHRARARAAREVVAA